MLLEAGTQLVLPVMHKVRGGLNGCAAHHAWHSTEVVLQGVARSCDSRGDSQLAINGAQMRFDGQQAHDELFGDLGVGESPSHQAQHFDLPFRQPFMIGDLWLGRVSLWDGWWDRGSCRYRCSSLGSKSLLSCHGSSL